jgi:uncharacterized membrane protein HdeD (DUF308 family)
MTIDIWVPMAIAAGVAAAFLYRKKRGLLAGSVLAVPPVLLCVYAATSRPADDALQAVLVSAVWIITAGLAALATFFWFRRPKRNA